MAHTVVIFGASGDLTARKLIPALYRLFLRSRLPEQTKIVGVARSEFTDFSWREQLTQTIAEHAGDEYQAEKWMEFSNLLHYFVGDIKSPKDFSRLATRLSELEKNAPADRTYYISTMPQLYEAAVNQLGAAGMADESQAARRIVIEKPFGTNLATAKRLNQTVANVFREEQVYRIDHYLGKETVQNILVLRFGNSMFEPLWNRNYIDNVQITVAEEVIVGRRADYYDRSGVLRDMFQNHILQLMMVTAMECPVKFDADSVRNEKVKVLQAVRKLSQIELAECGVRGQYHGYLEEQGVAPESPTETFAAIKLHVDNWRWKGVPFYLRSGKGMSCRTTQIVIEFKEPPHTLFTSGQPQANRLVIQIQPAEGLQIHFESKVPDAGMKTRQSQLDFRFDRHAKLPDAYQRLLQDVMQGDASLFARSDEVECAWGIIDPIISGWRSEFATPVRSYSLGSWGPTESSDWIARDGRCWFDVCPVLK